jgi:hypothetical protein
LAGTILAPNAESLTPTSCLRQVGKEPRHDDDVERTRTAGTMLCDQAWPSEDVERFRSWIDTGSAP